MRLEFSTETLLGVLQNNRAKHEETYKQASDGYKQRLLEAATHLATLAAEYQAGTVSHEQVDEGRHALYCVTKPAHWLAEYDRAIAMLKAANADTVELDAQDFSRFYEDNWEWKQQFVAIG